MCCRLKKQILDIQEGRLSKAACVSPDPCNADLGNDVVRLINAVLKKQIKSLELQACSMIKILFVPMFSIFLLLTAASHSIFKAEILCLLLVSRVHPWVALTAQM